MVGTRRSIHVSTLGSVPHPMLLPRARLDGDSAARSVGASMDRCTTTLPTSPLTGGGYGSEMSSGGGPGLVMGPPPRVVVEVGLARADDKLARSARTDHTASIVVDEGRRSRLRCWLMQSSTAEPVLESG